MWRGARLACLLCAGVLLAQQPENIQERILQAPLSTDERGSVTAALAAKDYPRVEALFKTIARSDAPHAGDLQALLGAIEFLAGRMEPAVEAFRKAESFGALDERDRFTLAMALITMGDPSGARTELDKLHRDRPEQPLNLYWLARIDYYQRRYEDAVAKLRRVIELDPGSARAEDNLGLSLDMMGRYEEARVEFVKAVELNRKLPHPSPWPPHNLGYLLLRLEKPEEAEQALRESLRYDPKFAQAHYHLGRVLEKRGRDAEAIEEYRTAISLDASLAEACYSLGLLYRKLGKTAEAEAAFAQYKVRRAASGNH